MALRLISFTLLLFFSLSIAAQSHYWVQFKNKKNTSFNPYSYFDSKAIDRRIKHNIALSDSSDFPINQSYINECENASDSIWGMSRWQNAIAVTCSEENAQHLENLTFVSSVTPLHKSLEPSRKYKIASYSNAQIAKGQTEVMGAKHFEQANINGKGIRIAILDAGFPDVNTNSAFEHIRNDNRIIKTFDFTTGEADVYHAHTHGTMVMSTIAGIDRKGNKMGLATEAEFLLARTEINLEVEKEEVYWLMAAEWADKNGADIINSSLGYTYHRYHKSDMDGLKSIVARAANTAASKGILVVNAAGNDGDGKWKVLGTPADADSVLSVGGVQPILHYSFDFSSYGPTSDGRLKPNVCGYGQAYVQSKEGKFTTVHGTSFASPLVAGFAACAMQAHPDLTNMEIFKKIEESSSLYPYFDYKHGYGIPQAKKILLDTDERHEFTFRFESNEEGVFVNLYPRKMDHPTPNLVYFHVNRNGSKVLYYYSVIRVEGNRIMLFKSNTRSNQNYQAIEGDKITVHYQGFTHHITYKTYAQ